MPDGLARHPCVFPIQHLHREDAILRHQVFKEGYVLWHHWSGQGPDHAVFHPSREIVQLGVFDHILPVFAVQELAQHHPVQSGAQLPPECRPVTVEPGKDLPAVNGGRPANVARVAAVDADIALPEVCVLVVDQHLNVVAEPHLEVGFTGREVGQQAEQSVFRQLASTLVELDLERVPAEVLPVKRAVLNPLLAEGHVQSVVELRTETACEEQGQHQPKAALSHSGDRHLQQSTHLGCRLFPLGELAGHVLIGIQRFF